ncbi:MAG: hypothetical protein IPO61_07385 [Gammaproteobacteria bacterium]|nr:hypothetical protein [Gammaproteobacteria bacterium]
MSSIDNVEIGFSLDLGELVDVHRRLALAQAILCREDALRDRRVKEIAAGDVDQRLGQGHMLPVRFATFGPVPAPSNLKPVPLSFDSA